MYLFLFLSFAPNLLRKAVKVEGTQEGIVGTKHSPEQLDVSYQNSHSTDMCSPNFLKILIINMLTDVLVQVFAFHLKPCSVVFGYRAPL